MCGAELARRISAINVTTCCFFCLLLSDAYTLRGQLESHVTTGEDVTCI